MRLWRWGVRWHPAFGSLRTRTGKFAYSRGLVLIVFIGIQVWTCLSVALGGVLLVDGSRDLAQAWKIVSGEELPLQGPLFGGAFHLGPLYFYLVALPLALWGTATAVIVFLSLLTLLGVGLAYKLGQLLFGREVGAAFALLLAGDFLTCLSSVQIGNSDLIVTATLAVLCALSGAVVQRKPCFLLWALVAGAVAVQIHPVTLTLLPLGVGALLVPMRERKLPYLLGGGLVVLLLFSPFLLFQITHNWPDIHSLLRNAPSSVMAMGSPFSLLRGYLALGPEVSRSFASAVPPTELRAVTLLWQDLLPLLAIGGGVFVLYRVFLPSCRSPALLILGWFLSFWLLFPFFLGSKEPVWYYYYTVHPLMLLLASLFLISLPRVLPVGKRPGHLLVWGILIVGYLASTWLVRESFRTLAGGGIWPTTSTPILALSYEEEMVKEISRREGEDIYGRLHGVPLLAYLENRGVLFLLHPPQGPASPSFHYLGLRRVDIPGQPITAEQADLSALAQADIGPFALIKYTSPLDYKSLRVSFTPTPGWEKADFADTAWVARSHPLYHRPDPHRFPLAANAEWEKSPIYLRATLHAPERGRVLLGMTLASVAATGPGAVLELFVEGEPVGPPLFPSSHVLLYDVTSHVTPGENTAALAVAVGAHGVVDLFALWVKE